jgi:hypothetical protein
VQGSKKRLRLDYSEEGQTLDGLCCRAGAHPRARGTDKHTAPTDQLHCCRSPPEDQRHPRTAAEAPRQNPDKGKPRAQNTMTALPMLARRRTNAAAPPLHHTNIGEPHAVSSKAASSRRERRMNAATARSKILGFHPEHAERPRAAAPTPSRRGRRP